MLAKRHELAEQWDVWTGRNICRQSSNILGKLSVDSIVDFYDTLKTCYSSFTTDKLTQRNVNN